MSEEFREFDKRRLGNKERKIIKKRNLLVLDFPKKINPDNLLGYAITDGEIEIPNENRKIILLNKKQGKKELKITFYHELAHHIMKDKGMNKGLTRENKEFIAESVSRSIINNNGGKKTWHTKTKKKP